jgi:PadR family transcriptional regulator PadR
MTTARRSKLGLLQGTLDMLILQALTSGPRHGYQIARWLESVTGDALSVEEGSLYPALHRMVQRGWVTSSWGMSENNRRAKFYTLTDDGTAQLEFETGKWRRFTDAIALVLQSSPA